MPDISAPLPFQPCEFTICANRATWTFLKPAHPEILLDLLTEKQFEKDRFLPYWAELWPSTEVLFEIVASMAVPKNLQICDLGCGLGAVAGYLSANGHKLYACDISPEACRYAQANILRYSQNALITCCDWRKSPFKSCFDMIVAADIIYEKQCMEPVVRFLSESIRPGGSAFIADPRRAYWNIFKAEIQQAGFVIIREYTRDINAGKTTIEVVHIRKTGSSDL
jgi:2-polyprenyl-3-methyl-5-hydroxy-6-metoxy-1,4-benzoquinol methylase